MGFWWCCCEDPCPIPETDIRVERWYLQVPPIPGIRVDLPSIDLTFTPDYFGPGDHAWRSGCLLKSTYSAWTVSDYFALDLTKAGPGGRGLDETNALAGACLYWVMDGFSASDCSCASHVVIANNHQGSGGGAGGNAFRACSMSGPVWNMVARTTSPFSETWNTGVQYAKFYGI